MTEYELNIRLAFMVGIFLTAAVFFLLFYFALRRRTALLWLALYCVSHPVKSLFKPYQVLVSFNLIPAYAHPVIEQIIVALGGFFLICFLLWELALRNKKKWAAGWGLFCLLAFFTIDDFAFNNSVIACGLALSAYGVYRGADRARWLLAGMLGYTVLNYMGNYDLIGFAYFVGIIFFILCMFFSIGQNVAGEIDKQQRALLRAVKLENQLLKSTIQPHFVFNSLAALQELIEQDPPAASDFVEKLAGEFQLMNKAARESLIPIEEELALCRMHLGIMEYRRNASFSLHTEGITGTEMIPPGLFHTLIENGITHGYPARKQGRFKLSKQINGDGISYRLYNDGSVNSEKKIVMGTGLSYIRAALEEQFGKRANLSWRGSREGWEVIIEIKN